MKSILPFLLTILFGIGSVLADVRLPRIFGDHMVLQRNTSINIWGWAEPGEVVKVSLNGQHKQTKADVEGKWSLNLKREKAGGPFELKVQGNNEVVLKDVLIGDVWVCSGQSNMAWILENTDRGEDEIKSSSMPQIRHIQVARKVASSPQGDLPSEAAWQRASPEYLANFTAVGYYFAKELQGELNVPIGLVNSSWGGTNIETWISKKAFQNSNEFKSMINSVPSSIPDTILKKGPNHAPSLLSNGMIEPLVPFNIKGVIWYQGESNAGLAHQYQSAFPLMIKDWRKRWNIGDFPFYFVQLASYKATGGNSDLGSTWAELREAQAMTLSLKNTGMAVTTDIGNSNDIHPRNKLDVGKRLAFIALNQTYKKKNAFSGPVFKKMKRSGNSIKLYFDHDAEGLTTKIHGDDLQGFEIAGADKSFKKAKAIIEKDYVLVYSDDVITPIAVRYGWSDDNFNINLFNKAGFPASPFRTDNWDGITSGKKMSYPWTSAKNKM